MLTYSDRKHRSVLCGLIKLLHMLGPYFEGDCTPVLPQKALIAPQPIPGAMFFSGIISLKITCDMKEHKSGIISMVNCHTLAP